MAESTYQNAKQARSLFHRISSWDCEHSLLCAERSEKQQRVGSGISHLSPFIYPFHVSLFTSGCCEKLITKALVGGTLRGNVALDFVLEFDSQEAHGYSKH